MIHPQTILLAAMVAGKATWQPKRKHSRVGRLVVGDESFETCVDEVGCPQMHDNIIRAINVAMGAPLCDSSAWGG